jgi:hypothetical protein
MSVMLYITLIYPGKAISKSDKKKNLWGIPFPETTFPNSFLKIYKVQSKHQQKRDV